MRIEQIKELYPPGTIFFPAHLHYSEDTYSNPHYQIKVEEGDTFYEIETGGDIYMKTHDERNLYWNPIVFYKNEYAKVLRDGVAISPTAIVSSPTISIEKKDLGDIDFLEDYPEILDRLIVLSRDNSLTPFIETRHAGTSNGGFNWDGTDEGYDFWDTIMSNRNPEHFYTVYPKETVEKVDKEPDIPPHYLHKYDDDYPGSRRSAMVSKPTKTKILPLVSMIEVKTRRII